MKLSLKKIFLAVCLASVSASAFSADEIKVGYVNIVRLLREAAPAKAAQARLDAERLKREKELDDLAARLKTATDKLEKESPTLSEADRVRRQRDLIDQDREIQRKRREAQEDMNQRLNEEQAQVAERANKVIKQIFETEKFDLILQDAVMAGVRVDITDKVIKALNASSK
ncbi:MAG: OmpH family outer membrane protein [Burkholderiales bacterium]